MGSKGNYIEIAGGTITERYEEDYNLYTGGHLILEAAKSVKQTGSTSGVSFNAPQQAPVIEEKQEEDTAGEEKKPEQNSLNQKADDTDEPEVQATAIKF